MQYALQFKIRNAWGYTNKHCVKKQQFNKYHLESIILNVAADSAIQLLNAEEEL